jgi:hypothetical protein
LLKRDKNRAIPSKEGVVRVLLDECVDRRLTRDIVGHEVKTARQMGWTTIKNGDC